MWRKYDKCYFTNKIFIKEIACVIKGDLIINMVYDNISNR